MFEALDRYKYGIIAALTAYVAIFMYLQLGSYEEYFEIEVYRIDHAEVAPEEEFQLKPENIEVPADFNTDVRNMVKDRNDSRPTSDENYFENKSPEQLASDVKALERQMQQEAGGSAERARLQRLIEERKEQQREAEQQRKENENNTPTEGGDTGYSGKTMVEFSLPNRDAFQNNKWYVRNPGYKCNNANGVVTVDIKVNNNGDVISAVVNEAQSSNVTGCMRDEALKYARLSRFNYSGSAPKSQSGQIYYTFISKR